MSLEPVAFIALPGGGRTAFDHADTYLDLTGSRLYVAIGDPGVVTVVDAERLADVETIETELGAHTIGWDPATAQLYAFAPPRGGALVFREAA